MGADDANAVLFQKLRKKGGIEFTACGVCLGVAETGKLCKCNVRDFGILHVVTDGIQLNAKILKHGFLLTDPFFLIIACISLKHNTFGREKRPFFGQILLYR